MTIIYWARSDNKKLLMDHSLLNVSYLKDEIRVYNDIDTLCVDHDQTNMHCVDIGQSF